MTVLVGDMAHPEEWIRPVPGEEMTFRTERGHTGVYPFICRTFVPYFSYPENQWYFMYSSVFESNEELARLF
jgi:hypothetical protein